MSNKSIIKIAVITVLSFFVISYLNAVPGEDYIFEGQYPSPDGKYTIDIYYDSEIYASHFASYAIVRRESFPRFARHIYMEHYRSDCEVHWIDNRTVNINGKELNIFFDSYKGVNCDWFEK